MAIVYLGLDPRDNRAVAIKVLPREFLFDPKFRARFKREAKVLISLQLPGVVPVYDVGESEGQPYIVMRYMAGGSLSQRISEGQLSLAETASILGNLAPALDGAHSRGLIHRDLKPGNVLFDESNLAYLSDFGIVKMTEGQSMTLTTHGGVLGTPAFMSPEQVVGKEKLDGRSDIYAIGVIFYQMLTGKLPYYSDTPMSQAMMHVLEPLPDVLKLRPDLPTEAQAIIEKAMAKDRDNRYPNARVLATAVKDLALRTDQTLAAAAPVTKGGTRKALTPLLAGFLAILCLVLGVGAVYLVATGRDDESTRPPTMVITTITQEAGKLPGETALPPATAGLILPDETTQSGSVRPEATSGLIPTLRPTLAATAESESLDTPQLLPTIIATNTPVPTHAPQSTQPPPPTSTSPPPPTSTSPPQPTNTPQPTQTNTSPPPTDTPQPTSTLSSPTDTPQPTQTSPPVETPPPTSTPTPAG
jgi:serine/threonine-protein kinase